MSQESLDQQQQAATVGLARQATQLNQMLRNPEAFTPDERVEAEGMLRDHINGVIERGSISTAELEMYDESMMTRITVAKVQHDLRSLKTRSQDPGRALSSMQVGLGTELHNLAGVGVDIVAAGLTPFTDPEGRTQAALDNTRNRIRASRERMQGDFEAQMVEMFGSGDNISEMVEFGGDMVGRLYPYLFVPYQLGTYTRTVMYNGLLGGVAGAGTVEDAQSLMDRMDGIKMGSLTGLFASGVLNARQGFQRYAARKIENQLNTAFAKESALLEKEIQQLTGQPDFAFSLGQITANPFVVGLEIGSARGLQRDAQLQRLQIMRDTLKMRANALRDAGRTPVQIVEDLQDTANNVLRGMRRNANQNFADAMDNVIANWGDDAVVGGKHYMDELGAIMDEWANPMVGGSSNAVPQFMLEQHAVLRRFVTPFRTRTTVRDGKTFHEVVDLRQFGQDNLDAATDALVARAGAPKRFPDGKAAADWARAQNQAEGGLTAEQTKDLLKGFRRMIGGEGPLFEGATNGSMTNLGQALRRAFLDELDMGVKNVDARNAVMSLRRVFETDALMMDGVRRTILTDFLGNIPQTGHESLLAAFTNRTPKELANVRNFLLEHDPSLLYDLQRSALDRVVVASRDPNMKRSLGDVDIFRLGEALAGSTRLPGSVAKGLWTPAEQAELSQLGRALQTLQETHLSLFPEASGSKLADVAINVQSRSPEFVARLLTRLTVSSTAVSRFLNDPQARRAVIEVANNPVGSPKYQMASMVLALTTAEQVAREQAEFAETQREQANIRNMESARQFADESLRRGDRIQ